MEEKEAAVKYLADTSVLIRSRVSQPRLTYRALEPLADRSSRLYLSAVSS
jgi:predicted nucleic acid-binding protein